MARRGEVVAALHHVVHKCGARDLDDVVALLKEDAGRDYVLQLLESDECRTAAAAATAFSDVPMPPVNVVLRVAAPPPPPPFVKAVLQIKVPRVPVAVAGTMTDCRTRSVKLQTARACMRRQQTLRQNLCPVLWKTGWWLALLPWCTRAPIAIWTNWRLACMAEQCRQKPVDRWSPRQTSPSCTLQWQPQWKAIARPQRQRGRRRQIWLECSRPLSHGRTFCFQMVLSV